MLAKFGTNAAMWSMNLVQVTESISGSVVPLAMFSCHLVMLEISQLQCFCSCLGITISSEQATSENTHFFLEKQNQRTLYVDLSMDTEDWCISVQSSKLKVNYVTKRCLIACRDAEGMYTILRMHCLIQAKIEQVFWNEKIELGGKGREGLQALRLRPAADHISRVFTARWLHQCNTNTQQSTQQQQQYTTMQQHGIALKSEKYWRNSSWKKNCHLIMLTTSFIWREYISILDVRFWRKLPFDKQASIYKEVASPKMTLTCFYWEELL